jgi:Tol biopolymer transport system component
MHQGTLIQEAYVAQYLTHGSIKTFYSGSDGYHPAASARGDFVWVEDARSNGSRILRFPLEIAEPAPAEPTVEVENAEQPVMSSDGKLLAFIREIDGRNSLWIHRPGAAATADSIVAGPEYDVHEAAFFPDDRVVFSSRHAHRFRLYEFDNQNAVPREMNAPSCSARYPAVSPDGRWLAYSCEEAGMWHLHTLRLDTDDEVEQTRADCNAFNPAWTLDSKSLIYATDCGRGLGMTALAKLNVIK